MDNKLKTLIAAHKEMVNKLNNIDYGTDEYNQLSNELESLEQLINMYFDTEE